VSRYLRELGFAIGGRREAPIFPGCILRRPRPLSPMDPPKSLSDTDSTQPAPHERVQKLRLGVRIVWWSAVVLAVVFASLALWLWLAKSDLFAVFYAVLAVCCALAGYGTLLAVRRRAAS